MAIVDGRALAAQVRAEVAAEIQARGLSPRLGIVACAPNFETKTYLDLKEKTATSLGVTVVRRVLDLSADTAAVIKAVHELTACTDGLIVQLPLPSHIDRVAVLAAVPPERDVDAFAYTGEMTEVLPPVVGAIELIAKQTGVVWKGSKVVIFGGGRLVGQPMAYFAAAAGAEVSVVTAETDAAEALRLASTADCIVLGVGRPRLLRPGMVKTGVAVFDAGASEEGGVIVGDADPEVANVASVFTPVPGGIGPLTVALIFRNLLKILVRQ